MVNEASWRQQRIGPQLCLARHVLKRVEKSYEEAGAGSGFAEDHEFLVTCEFSAEQKAQESVQLQECGPTVEERAAIFPSRNAADRVLDLVYSISKPHAATAWRAAI